MKVLLLKDVYKLGRAGDVKKVADGYGRNYLLPQGLAVLARPGMLKQADRIRHTADEERVRLNQELGSVAEKLNELELIFPVKAGETGRLYGSVTNAMIADKILEISGVTVQRRQIDSQTIKTLGVHTLSIRLTMDLVSEVKIVVHSEDEPPESAYALMEEGLIDEAPPEDFADLRAELEAQEKALEEQAEMEEEAVDQAVVEEQEIAQDKQTEADEEA